MKRLPSINIPNTAAVFLQGITVVIALITLTFLLWEPQMEGRNANATFFEIYFTDPFLAYVYLSAVPFFVALFQLYRFFGSLRQSSFPGPKALTAIRRAKRYFAIMIPLTLIAMAMILVLPSDDHAGGVAMGLFATLVFASMAALSAVLEKILGRTPERSVS